MRVLLIGGSGFIGSHLVDTFLEHGQEVVVYDRKPEKFRAPIPGVRLVQGEMGNRGELEAAFADGIKRVVMLASSTLPETSNDDPLFDVQTNLLETLALLELCVKYKVKRFVFSSSGGTVYGMPNSLPINEEHPTNPMCSYGIVKLAIEKYLHLYHRLFGLQYVALRLSNPYGIRQDPGSAQGIIPVFASRILQRKPITVWGDGSAIRDFIHVKDVASLFYKALRSDVNGIFNVGSGVGASIKDLLTIIPSRLQLEANIVWAPPRKFDVPAVVLDCTKARGTFSWKPRIGLEEGVAEISSWIRDEMGKSTSQAFCATLAK